MTDYNPYNDPDPTSTALLAFLKKNIRLELKEQLGDGYTTHTISLMIGDEEISDVTIYTK